MTESELADTLNVSTQTIYNWINNRVEYAPYIPDAIKAAKAGLSPVNFQSVCTNWRLLNVSRQTVYNWRRNKAAPMTARYAMAWSLKDFDTPPTDEWVRKLDKRLRTRIEEALQHHQARMALLLPGTTEREKMEYTAEVLKGLLP